MTAVTETKWMLEPDSVLAHRDILLSESEMAARFSRLLKPYLDTQLKSCTRMRTKYRVGVSLRALYQLEIAGQSYSIAARHFPASQFPTTIADSHQAKFSCHPLPPVFVDSRIKTVFWTFPNDRKIASLNALTEVPVELSDIRGKSWTSSKVVAHAPEKSVTAQCLSDSHDVLAYAKFYAGTAGRRIREIYRNLGSRLPLAQWTPRLPDVFDYVEAKNLLLLEPIEGKPLTHVTAEARSLTFFDFGAALGRLHQITPPPSLSPFVRLTPKCINKAAWTIAQARPDAAWLTSELARCLATTHDSSEVMVVLHGDVRAKNALVHDGRLSLIDLDQAGIGPAAADLGSFLGTLHYDECLGQRTSSERVALQESFLAGYEQTAILPGLKSLRWHTAAALIAERAFRSVNRVRVDGLLHLREVLERAAALLKGNI